MFTFADAAVTIVTNAEAVIAVCQCRCDYTNNTAVPDANSVAVIATVTNANTSICTASPDASSIIYADIVVNNHDLRLT